MTKDDIIRMAREAGLFTHKEVQPQIERFANLVYAAAATSERAKVQEDVNTLHDMYEQACRHREELVEQMRKFVADLKTRGNT